MSPAASAILKDQKALPETTPVKLPRSAQGVPRVRREGKKRTVGRVLGPIASRSRGASKRHYRLIDFKRDKFDVAAKVKAIESDPYGSVHVALLHYADGEERYIYSPVGLEVGQTIISGANAEILPGNALPLENIPVGTVVHNIELRPGRGAQMARLSEAQLLSKEDGVANLELPSGEVRRVDVACRATVGQLRRTEGENPSRLKVKRNTAPTALLKTELAPTHFAQVYARAVEVIGSAAKAMSWLGRPIAALKYATPISLLRNERGRDAVLDVLGRLEHGVF